ncbi:MAG: 3-hydroxyacyl-CoA dehydrogenase NAD-binding domain-containing protein [Pseudorhodobacter sp.]|nr:3-hydroxyacyl-CoA dehydrogenase NAD-binding domain-containing protein [Pseudorhodobacter sp.]
MAVIGVAGLGVMGLGIVQVYAAAGFDVVATDAHEPTRASGLLRLREELNRRIAAGKMTEDAAGALLARIRICPDLAGLATADLVIEAIAEDLEAKRRLFAGLEDLVAASALLASNTSSLQIGQIGAGLRHPERLIGLHFFNPAPAMKLVELVAPKAASFAALSQARALTEAAGKTVVQCADTPGFIVNRCARPYYGEALALLDEGRTAGEIDAAMRAAGYPLGPFALIDLIGADINLAATRGLWQAMGKHPRYHVFPALEAQVAKGHLGRKSGKGFSVAEALPPPPDAEAIVLRIEAALVNEAAFLTLEGGVAPPEIDTAMRLGLNFPRGPFAALHHWGRPRILATLADCAAKAPAALDGRYTPAPLLSDPGAEKGFPEKSTY